MKIPGVREVLLGRNPRTVWWRGVSFPPAAEIRQKSSYNSTTNVRARAKIREAYRGIPDFSFFPRFPRAERGN